MDAVRRTAISDDLARLADGDRSAFAVLMTELWPVVMAFAKRTVRETADAEDVAQEVFVKVASRIADYDRDRDGLTWVYAITAFEIRTHLRRLQRRREGPALADDAEPVDPTPPQVDLMIDEEVSRMLTGALVELSAAERALLGVGEASVDAALTGTVIRKRRQRALAKLRSAWSHLYD
jgi:RNA polymerase sigma-70 factor (ECF subfamily)